MTLDPEYGDFILTLSKAIEARTGGVSFAHDLTGLMEELGEVARAYADFTGSNPRRPATGNLSAVAQELADVACSALVAIANLGYSPSDMLQWEMDKVKTRYPEVWELRS